ncbi:MAG: hypothetical protein K2M00_06595 [Muribaculaceae bacterium]|nr:hypothetical protein [Muribaculaceae bacterium]
MKTKQLLLAAALMCFSLPLSAQSLAHPTLEENHDYGWTTWGEGYIVDGWLTGIWYNENYEKLNPEEWKIKCTFEKSTTPEGFIRILEPWVQPSSWFSSHEEPPVGGRDLIIEVVDGGMVIIMPQLTGIQRNHPVSRTKIEYLVHNYEGYALSFKDDIEGVYNEIYASRPEYITTYEDGVITVPLCMWCIVNAGQEITTEDIGGANDNIAKIYTPDSSSGTISVNVADGDADKEFYDLCGRKVTGTPSAGIYICKKGGKTFKIAVK